MATKTTVAVTASTVAASIDHSLLQPQLTYLAVDDGLALARARACASVCVRPCDVARAAAALAGSAVRVCSVIGFPHGSVTTATKLAEAAEALRLGAVELDVVINVAALRSGDDALVRAELEALTALAAGAGGATVKVICENAYLSAAEKRRAFTIAVRAGAAFLKTSTGYGPSGSTPDDLRLMRDVIAAEGAAGRCAIKAAGGIRTLDAWLEAARCGATRVGATATAAILDEFAARAAATGGVLRVDVEPPRPLEQPADAGGPAAAGPPAGGGAAAGSY